MNNQARISGAAAIIATLRSYNVNTIFGIPGIHSLPLYDALYMEPDIRHVLARHEQGAGFMAEGYARISGHPGIVCTITGPGVTNIATPIASAYADSIPLLVISTGLPRASKGRARGELHEVKNQAGVMEALAGWTRTVEYVEEIPYALHDAFRTMYSGRSRGAYLQVPCDLLEETAEITLPPPTTPTPREPEINAIREATRLLATAKKPLILAGAGVTFAGANTQLAQLAELLHAPVILGSKSHDVLPTDHPLVITVVEQFPDELRTLVEHADIALVIGSKLGDERTYGGKFPLPSTVIQADIDPAEIGRNYHVTQSIIGDARSILEALLQELQHSTYPHAITKEELAEVRSALEQRTRYAHGDDGIALLDSIRAGLPRESIIVADMTMLGYASSQHFPVYDPRTFIHPSEFCTIGCGLPLALGAKVAAPERPVVALCGDGGFLLNVGELATAVQEKLPVIIVIFNDSTYTTVKKGQQSRFNAHYIATDLVSPDYVAIAQAFYADGIRAKTPEALHAAIGAAIQRNVPTIIEVPLPRQW